jgi:hypothetical protein
MEMRHKKPLITLMLALVSSSAVAAWTAVGGSNILTAYVDYGTIRKAGKNKVKMWGLHDLKTMQHSASSGVAFLSSKHQDEYDCKEEQMRALSFYWFSENMGGGKVVFFNDYPDTWSPVQPGSIEEILFKVACNKK